MHKFCKVFLILFVSAPIWAITPKKIVANANDLLRSKSSFSEITMSVIKPDWSRDFRMNLWAVEPDYALILITEPARDKGMVTLKREKEVWNWIPKVQRVIKIPPSMMLQSWMGSDFTNDDLVRESSIVEDYTHTLLGEEQLDGYLCYKIQLIPKPDAGVVWGKIILWITKDSFMELRADYYDEDDFLIKSMFGTDVRSMGGRILPTKWEMVPYEKEGQKTILKYHSIEFDKKIKNTFFSQQNMKRLR
jgi:outer membrane lipoprotein-sorting protein